MSDAPGKILLLLACLLIPGLWGILVERLFVRFWPASWRRGVSVEKKSNEHIDPNPPHAWDYQI